MFTIEDYLARNAREIPEKVAVVCSGESLTYSKLYALAVERASEFVGKQRIVPFRASQDIEFLIEYFAIHIAGRVAMPLEKDVPDDLFEAYCQTAEKASVPEEAADVLFTTGTTGRSKGVVISHRAIVADAENLVEAQGYESNVTFIISGPLNHIGSLSKIYPTVMVGGTLHITEGMKCIDDFFRAAETAKGPVATFLVPASIRMLLAFGERRLAELAGKVAFIETGAAPISVSDMQRLCAVLPGSRLFNTYASTETGIIATYDYNAGGCIAGCLGKPMRNSSITITAEGYVACKGQTLMTGYLGDKEQTGKVLRNGMLVTSDIGHIDAEGRLMLEGRSGDVINVGGYKVVPTEVEDVAMALPQIVDCLCVPANHPVLGTVLKLLTVMEEGVKLDKRAIALALKASLESYKVPVFYEQVEEIRRTFNGKPDRKSYLPQ